MLEQLCTQGGVLGSQEKHQCVTRSLIRTSKYFMSHVVLPHKFDDGKFFYFLCAFFLHTVGIESN